MLRSTFATEMVLWSPSTMSNVRLLLGARKAATGLFRSRMQNLGYAKFTKFEDATLTIIEGGQHFLRRINNPKEVNELARSFHQKMVVKSYDSANCRQSLGPPVWQIDSNCANVPAARSFNGICAPQRRAKLAVFNIAPEKTEPRRISPPTRAPATLYFATQPENCQQIAAYTFG